MHDSTGKGRTIDTNFRYSKLPFNFISVAKPGGSASYLSILVIELVEEPEYQ